MGGFVGGGGAGGGGGLAGPSASVYNHAAQSLSPGDNTVLFDSELWDTGSIHSTTTNTGRLTAPSTGFYLVAAGIGLNASNAGQWFLYMRVNGAVPTGPALVSNSGTNTSASVSCVLSLSAGDYVEFTASMQNACGTVADRSWGQMTKLATAWS